MRKAGLHLAGFAALFLLAGGILRADAGCLTFLADPASYSAPAGGTFTVSTTFTNCDTDTTIMIGSSFGSDSDPNVSNISFYDPFFFLGPGASVTTSFADYTWDPNAPGGFTWNPAINSEYGVFAGACDASSCSTLLADNFAFTHFTATVDQPVPEPATIVLLATGAAGAMLKLRRRKRA